MKILRNLVALVPLLVAAGCGGGGGDGSLPPSPETAPTPPPTPAPPPCVQTAEHGCIQQEEYEEERRKSAEIHSAEEDFENQWGLSAIGAHHAYARIELEYGAGTDAGTGVTVGLIDTGIDTGHPVFSGKMVIEEFLSEVADETGDENSHGTAVASIIAGRPSPSFTASVDAGRGVAPGADIAMFAIPVGEGGDYVPVSLSELNAVDDRWAARFRRALDWSRDGRTLDFVNLSVGFRGLIEQYGEQQLRDSFGHAIATLEQRDASEKTVFVWSAGNAHGQSCDGADFPNHPELCADETVDARSVNVLPGLTVRFPELRTHMVAVVATGEDGAIAPYSNRCGIAADWCLAAPGTAVRAAYFGPHPDDGSPGARGAFNADGTSFAAPMVTGSLAVMKHLFRDQLSNTALLTRLLATADDQGDYADPVIYGQGHLDLAAATNPVGATSIALGDRVDGPGNDPAQSGLALGSAFGDGPARALAGQEIAAFDALGAPFWYALDGFANAAPVFTDGERLQAFMAPRQADPMFGTGWSRIGGLAAGAREDGPESLRLGLLEPPSGRAGSGHLALAGPAFALRAVRAEGFGFAAFTTEGMRGPAPASGAVVSWRRPDLPIGLRGGVVTERETLLGTRADGAFGRLSGDSAYLGVNGGGRLGGWRLDAGAELGIAHVAARDGVLAGVSPLTTSAFAVRAERAFDDEGSFALSVSQPLRVESGRARLSVPVGRTRDGRVLRRQTSTELAPTGRQLEIGAEWRRPAAGDGELRLGAVWTRQPGHAAAGAPELTLLAGWRRSF